MAVKKTTTKQASLDGDATKPKAAPAAQKAGAKRKAAPAKSKAAATKPKADPKRVKTASEKAKAPAPKATSGPARSRTPAPGLEERRELIEQTAYLKAEADGFSGDPVQYWLEAEAEVLASRRKGKRK